MNIRALYETLTELYPDEKWRYMDETETLDFNNLKFENNFIPDEAKIKEKFDVKIVEIENNIKATQYQRDRQPEYLAIGNQLDMIYWDKKNGTKKWEEAIDKVKADHPKG
jgi:hypothetical protein